MPHTPTPHRRKGTPTATKPATRGAGRKRVTVELRRELAEEWRALGGRAAGKCLEETMVFSLVRSHRITASRGAELLGMPYQAFLDLLARNDVAIFDYQPG